MKLIFNIFRDPENKKKTKISAYSDKNPYELKQEIKVDFEIYNTTCATDRRDDN